MRYDLEHFCFLLLGLKFLHFSERKVSWELEFLLDLASYDLRSNFLVLIYFLTLDPMILLSLGKARVPMYYHRGQVTICCEPLGLEFIWSHHPLSSTSIFHQVVYDLAVDSCHQQQPWQPRAWGLFRKEKSTESQMSVFNIRYPALSWLSRSIELIKINSHS